MTTRALVLRTLRIEDENMFRAAVREVKTLEPGWTFAFDYDESADFAGYVARLESWARGEGLAERFVPNPFLVAVVDGVIVGRVSIRHELNHFLFRVGGYIGFGVVPSQRNIGYATEMLRQAVLLAADLGLARVLVTCDEGNVGSKKVIEKNGGVFDGRTEDAELSVPKRRYWIDTAAP